MRLSALLLACLIGLGMTCNPSQRKYAYQTVYSLEQTTAATYRGYLSAVATGQAPTNDVPRISHLFDAFQQHVWDVSNSIQNSTNGLAPSDLVVQAADLVATIESIKRKTP